MYKVFSRTWWRSNPNWPDKLEPHMGKKTTIAEVNSYEEAKQIAQEWNKNHNPDKYSRKAEFTKI